jgi:hypothetical protein
MAAGAIAAAVVLVFALSSIVLVTSDQALANRLASLTASERAIVAARYDESGRATAATDAAMARTLAAAEAVTEHPTAGVLFRRTQAEGARFELQLAALDDPATAVRVESGRLPSHCDGATCEAVLLSRTAVPVVEQGTWRVADLELSIVGRATPMDDRALGPLDLRGPAARPGDDSYFLEGSPPAAILLVAGTEPLLLAPSVERVGRTLIRTAALRPDALRAWRLGELRDAIDAAQRSVGASGVSVRSPLSALEEEASRAAAGAARLSAVGSLAVAVLLAFVLFGGLLARGDVNAELIRLSRLGATRRQRRILVPLQAGATALLGGLAGLVAGIAASAAVALLAGAPVDDVVGAAVLAPAPLLLAGGLTIGSAIVLALGTTPGADPRSIARLAGGAALVAAVILGWQAVAAGPQNAEGLAFSVGGPLLTILPAAATFVLALAFLAVLPVVLRVAVRAARRAPLWLRLALVSTARSPEHPAAAAVLLALGTAAVTFAIGYIATLDRSNVDVAAYRAGLDVRVIEGPSPLSATPTVLPLDRYATLGADVAVVPVMRLVGSGPSGSIELIGLPAGSITGLPGWRTDFAPRAPDALAGAIDVPGDSATTGHALPAGAGELSIPLRYTGDPLRLAAFVRAPGGQVVRVDLGSVRPGERVASAQLPEGTAGGTLIGLELSADELIAGEYHEGGLRGGSITFGGLEGLVGESPIAIEVAGIGSQLIHAGPEEPPAVPAIVPPAVAARADANGELAVSIGRTTLRLRVAATASAFPTVADRAAGFAVVDLPALQRALAAAIPAATHPNEVWLDAPAERAPAVRSALGQPPFRVISAEWREDLAAASAADPVARAAAGGLLVAALVALVLAVVGILIGLAADLADERGELADLESQGVAPRELGAVVVARALGAAAAGGLVGLVVGSILAHLGPVLASLAADARPALPPLVPVVPVVQLLAVIGVTIGGAAAVSWILARRALADEPAIPTRPAGEPGTAPAAGTESS